MNNIVNAPEEDRAAVAAALGFVRAEWPKIMAISAAILIPCFWHRWIFCADLGSHLYNAWLAQLIERGQVHGLWLARQWNNVLFDYLLSGLGSIVGWRETQWIAASLAVLTFFWGMFALASATARRAPWFIAPVLALFTYGWTFQMGFFNYYLSLGFSFIAIAILWRCRGRERWLALALLPLMYLAHPLGVIWFAGASAYLLLAEAIPRRWRFMLFAVAAVLLFGVHIYLTHHYVTEASPFHFYAMNGADQLVLYGRRYDAIEWAFLLFAAAALGFDALKNRERAWWRGSSVVLQLFLLALLAVPLLPRGVHFPDKVAAVALLTDRLTSVTAALGCCLLAAMRPAKWHLVASLGIGAVFFAFVFQDTGVANKMEAQAEHLVRSLPPNQRVMATIRPLAGSRIPIQHIIDLACIGHCFSYGNYEPGSGMFRVRATAGNPYVLEDYGLAVEMEEGDYTVREQDLPVYQIYQCTATGMELCIRPLEEGEDNDSLGVHPAEESPR
jgi:hypothetical protein